MAFEGRLLIILVGEAANLLVLYHPRPARPIHLPSEGRRLAHLLLHPSSEEKKVGHWQADSTALGHIDDPLDFDQGVASGVGRGVGRLNSR